MQLALPSRDYYQKENSEAELEAYHRYMTNMAILLGADPKTAVEEFKRVISLEKELANVCNLSDNFLLCTACNISNLIQKLQLNCSIEYALRKKVLNQ